MNADIDVLIVEIKTLLEQAPDCTEQFLSVLRSLRDLLAARTNAG